jgi:hypothetical protein
VRLGFTLRPGQFVDLDTLAETALAGLRDAGLYPRGFAGLEAFVAEKGDTGEPGVRIATASASRLRGLDPPGPCALSVIGEVPGTTRAGKATWRAHIAGAWGERALLTGDAWAEVTLAVDGSLLGPLEPVLDALEPVLGRDPRGRVWQEFFPADDRITWLRVSRARAGGDLAAGSVHLRLGARGVTTARSRSGPTP